MIRLVKAHIGIAEIKKAQIKVWMTTLSSRVKFILICLISLVLKLLAAPEFYPGTTHNAQTLATIYHLADPSKYYAGQYEFQCLHGMGEPLYEQVVGPREQNKLGVPCRIYAWLVTTKHC